MNTLTVNLHLMLATFYRPTRERPKILIEKHAFSSDRYAVASQIRLHGFDPASSMLEIGPRPGEEAVRTEDVLALIEREGAQIATVMLPGVQFLNGQRFDLRAIAQQARVAQAVASVSTWLTRSATCRCELHDCGADFAVWCHYKYLNAGPGAIGGCFVHERHARDFDLVRLARLVGPRQGEPLRDAARVPAVARRRGLADFQSADSRRRAAACLAAAVRRVPGCRRCAPNRCS